MGLQRIEARNWFGVARLQGAGAVKLVRKDGELLVLGDRKNYSRNISCPADGSVEYYLGREK